MRIDLYAIRLFHVKFGCPRRRIRVPKKVLACQPKFAASVRPAFATATADSLREKGERRLVTLTFASWNRIREGLRRLDALRRVA
jgi:hypothetical protein